jgi:RNA polymerase sigma-70 factor, ECF subfamily
VADGAGPKRPAVDAAAFTNVVREHGGAVFGFALRRVGNRATAEDLAQETFLHAWRARASFRGETSVRGWLLAITANVVRDWARRARRRPAETLEAGFGDAATMATDPGGRVETAEAIDRLRAALGLLSPRHREMFLLRERDGLSYKEIAAALAVPIGSVMSGLARARERLIKSMEGS